MRLTSPEFDDGGKLPEKVSYIRENVNPVLEISEVPKDAESLALIFEDPDAKAAAGKVWLHWSGWNIDPGKDSIEEGESLPVEGETDFRETGYNGPNPPDGDHKCVFKLYALKEELDLDEGASRKEFESAIEGKIIEKAELEALFEKID